MKTPPRLAALPFHLALNLSGLMSSTIAFECWKNGLSGLNPPGQPSPPHGAALEKLSRALQSEALARAEAFLTGLQAYSQAAYARELPEPPAVWHGGGARLLDYSALAALPADAPVALFIPSLINRYYILDLAPQRSLARYLTQAGVHVLMLDWQSPGDEQAGYDCADYVQHILLPALEFAAATTGRPIIPAGYCMGGVLALAAAQLRPKLVSALALLATPWDFHSPDFRQVRLDEAHLQQFESLLDGQDHLPAEVIQTLFYLNDPWLFSAKFQRFAGLAPDSPAAREFVALEGWVNDGVPMTIPTARECLIGWAQRNMLANRQWKIGRQTIRPQSVTCPAFVALPRTDTIVPPGCARPLAEQLREVTLIEPGSGHVSMVVGKHARSELWEPLKDWLLSLS